MKKHLLFTTFVVLIALSLGAQPAGWTYRLPITISNPGSTVYGAVVPIYINTANYISASQMQPTGDDIRFGTPCYGSTIYNYYIDSGMNTAGTKFLVQIDTMPNGNKTIYMFYGNSSATPYSALSTNIYQNGPISADNSVSGGSLSSGSNAQRGFQFVPNQNIMVTSFGKNTPSANQRYVTLFQYSNQSIVYQDTVSGPAGAYAYHTIPNPIMLSSGTSYVLEVFCSSSDPSYYYQTSSTIAPQLTYVNMLYCNSCSQNTFPTTVLTNYHYGYPDLQFYTLSLPNPLPTVSVGVGTSNGTPPTITQQPQNDSVCNGASGVFSVAASGASLTYQWQVNMGTGYANIANSAQYSGATSATLNISNVNLTMSGYKYQCIVSGNACASATSNFATLTVNSTPAVIVDPFDASICPGGNTGFSITAVGANLIYQWQENSGSGFHSLSNNALYSGVNTSNLVLVSPSGTMAGYSYRCIISSNCGIYDTSGIALLTVFSAPGIAANPVSDTVCENATNLFHVSATGSSLQYQWQVNSGAGFVNLINGGGTSGVYTSTLSIIFVPYTYNGYRFRCIVSAGGCAPFLTTDSATMTVRALPNVTSQPSPNATCAGGGATFTVGGVGYGLTYQWQENNGFGFTNITNGGIYSGATTGALVLSNVASTMNNYTYRCVLSGLCSTNAYSAAVPLVLTTPPVATFSSLGTTTLCPGTTVQLSANQNPNYVYQWQLNGIDIPGATSPIYVANSAGSYRLVAAIGNGNCASTSSAVAVTMLNAPPSVVSASGPTMFCQGGSVNLSGNNNPNLTYTWYLNGNLIASAISSSYTANVSGSYVMNTYDGNCHTNSTPTAVTVNPVPTANIYYAGNGYFCQGGTVTLSANSGTALSYQWYTGNFPLSGATADSFVVASSGVYKVIVSNTYGCADTSAMVSLASAPVPPTTVTPVGPTTVCSGNSVMLNGPSGSGLTYQWNKNGVAVAGASNAYYQASATGNYTLTVTNLNGLGCSATSSPAVAITVNNNPLPPASITYNGGSVICFGDSLMLHANTAPGYTYVWSVNSTAISGATAATYIAHSGGQYEVAITDANGCIGTSSVVTLTADTPLSPTIYKAGNNLNTGNSYASYQWYKNGNIIGGATTYTYNTSGAPGTYTVLVSDALGCYKMSPANTVVGISNVNSPDNTVTIFPNPATSVVNVEAQVKVNVSVSTIEGKLMLHKDDCRSIDISQLANGVYFIQVFNADNTLLKSERFIKSSK